MRAQEGYTVPSLDMPCGDDAVGAIIAVSLGG